MSRTRKLTTMAGVLTFLAALSLTFGACRAEAQNEPTDDSITRSVKAALMQDPRIPQGSSIEVITEDGIVQLTGTVDSLAAKQYADLEAKKIRGVRGVVNQLTVNVPVRDDATTADDIMERILDDSSISTDDIGVDVQGGNVTLSGNVASWAEAQEAELLATETVGVRSVDNELVPTYLRKRSDGDIRADVEAALVRDVYLTGLPISVSVKNGAVALNGTVGTAYERERAESDTLLIWDVASVDNRIAVRWRPNRQDRSAPPVPSDDQLVQAVTDELSQDLRIANPWDIAVEAESGHVTLSGSAPVYAQKLFAGQDAGDVVGVAWVTNLIQVNGQPRSDAAIADDVRFDLNTDYALSSDNIAADVQAGVVTLSGQVSSFWEMAHAVQVASRVKGVLDVVNDIHVGYVSGANSDGEIRDLIEDLLAANAETEWVADDISVAVNGGKVTLTGTVNFWSEYDAAEDVAYNTAGVWAVVNNLRVRDYDSYDWDTFAYTWPDTYLHEFDYPGHVYHYWWRR